MTDLERSRRLALLAKMAADLELHRAAQAIKKGTICLGRHSPNTVRRIFQGRNCEVATIVDVADDLDLDVEIRFIRRSA